MYCVIQEIELKKPNPHGYHKELKADSYTFTIGGVTNTKYTFNYTGGRFEWPVNKAYKISIHQSKRINGVVTKKQYAVTTVSYYDLVDFWIGDCMNSAKLDGIAEKLETDTNTLWDLINAKVDTLQEHIQAEFKRTEEYKTHKRHEKIIDKHNKVKAKFAKTYDYDVSEYDYCYNVFGELMNNDYYDKVIDDYKRRRSYQKQAYDNHSSYSWDNFKSGYSNYLNTSSGAYTESEKAMLKKFYRTLSKEFHPDVTRSDGEEMQLINRLKEAWGI